MQANVAGELATIYLYDLPNDYLETYQDRIGAVSAADVKSAAPLLLTPDRSVIAIVGDWDRVKDQLRQFGGITFRDTEGRTLPAAPSE